MFEYDSDSSYSNSASDSRSDSDDFDDYSEEDYNDSDSNDSYFNHDRIRVVMGSGSSSEESDSDDEICYEADLKPTSVPRLERMALFSVAIALWNHATVAIPGIITNHGAWRTSLDDEVPKWIDALPIPKSFTKCITKHFNNVKFNANEWISYIFRAVFLKQGRKTDLYQYINLIVWYPNDSINSVATARNLLQSDKLTKEEKFRLACTYCMQEDVEKIWPTTDENAVLDKFRFVEFPLICYWKRYCAEKLDKTRAPRKLYKDEIMIQQDFVDNWPAIEYFFDRLDVEQRVSKVIWFVEKGSSFQKLLLAKLDESRRLPVIMEKLSTIMSNFADLKSEDGHECVVEMWYDVRSFITQDQFVTLFNELLVNSTEASSLMEIWNSTPDDFKRHIFKSDYVNFVKKVMRWFAIKGNKEISFVSSLLLESADVDSLREITKTTFFSKECCRQFLCYSDVELLDQLINIFLPEAAESTSFKLSLAKTAYFRKRCKELISGLQIQTLVKFLDFGFSKNDPSAVQFMRQMLDPHLGYLNQKCSGYYSTGNLKGLNDFLALLASSYPEIVADYKKKLLFGPRGIEACMNHFGPSYDILAAVIADGIPIESVAEFKKKIILSPKAIDKLQKMILDGLLSDAENCARWFLESDSDRKELRTLLIDRLNDEKSCVEPETTKKFSEFLL
ncbi:uncharacterized protein LOC135843865 [Planococcus citri]|uniref:uncharacterized protein LOC135843865 n=1 Tax=Planococcus citri TaxID=170843 RepID=UPI0031F74E89